MSNEWSNQKKEGIESVSEKENIEQAREKIDRTGIFDQKYLKNIALVVFSMKGKPVELFRNGITEAVKGVDYNIQDFMQGRRLDFVGVHAKKDFIEIDLEKLNDMQSLPILFFAGKLNYEEFLVHEMAHNLFDREYVESYGEFEDIDGVTDVSSEYRDFIFNRLKKLFAEQYPGLVVDKFNLQRQKIAEIFAMMYEREFCNRSGINVGLHASVKDNVDNFLANPDLILEEFNKKHHRTCKLEDIFKENHILSLIASPVLEEKYPDFENRKKFFWKK